MRPSSVEVLLHFYLHANLIKIIIIITQTGMYGLSSLSLEIIFAKREVGAPRRKIN